MHSELKSFGAKWGISPPAFIVALVQRFFTLKEVALFIVQLLIVEVMHQSYGIGHNIFYSSNLPTKNILIYEHTLILVPGKFHMHTFGKIRFCLPALLLFPPSPHPTILKAI